jgi:hypothetical protein
MRPSPVQGRQVAPDGAGKGFVDPGYKHTAPLELPFQTPSEGTGVTETQSWLRPPDGGPLARKIDRIARERSVSAETLVNLRLQEKAS